MAISDKMRDLICKFGRAKKEQGRAEIECNSPLENESKIHASQTTFKALCDAMAELEEKAYQYDQL